MGLIIHPISSAARQGFVEARHQGLAVLAELIHHLRQARQVVAARQAPLVLLQLGLRPVEIINGDGDHSIANLLAQPTLPLPGGAQSPSKR